MDARPSQFLLKENRDNFEQASALFAWGSNTINVFGNGDEYANVSSPVKVTVNTSWTAISLSQYGSHTLAIRNDGALFAWGLNTSGQIGNIEGAGTVYTPVQIGTDSWIAVSAGGSHSLGIRYIGDGYGSLFAWGNNYYGQIGDGTTNGKSSPVAIGSLTWVAVSAGASHSVGIKYTAAGAGTLYTWGTNSTGQLGRNISNALNVSTPVAVGSNSWIMISAGYGFNLAIRYIGAGYGSLFAWGENTYGGLGDGSTVTKSSPVAIGSSTWIAVSAGAYHSLGIRRTAAGAGTLFTWGLNTYGQLGRNISSALNVSTPVAVGSNSWIMISAGLHHSLAIRYVGAGYGSLYAWGYNGSGGLGDGSIVTKSSPVQIGSNSWTLIDAGNISSAGNVNPSVLYMWGSNTEFPHANVQNFSSPLQIGSQSWKAVAIGSTHALGLLSTGALYAWGSNTIGQLGLNDIFTRNSPVQIGDSSWMAIGVGISHCMAIRKDGALFTWGNGGYGQLGDNTSTNKSSPVQIGTSSWIAISAGYRFNMAIRKDGALFAWGENTHGQLGDNSATNAHKSSPVQIGTSSWLAVAAGLYHSLAIRKDGGLFTWGYCGNGELGNNNKINKSSPVQIGTSSWIIVGSGHYSYNSMAIRADRMLFIWGANSYGQLGDETTEYRSSPVQIGSSKWKFISSSLYNTYAVRIDGALFGIGGNGSGFVGDGTTINRSSPVQIGLSSWNMAPVLGEYAVMAIKTAP